MQQHTPAGSSGFGVSVARVERPNPRRKAAAARDKLGKLGAQTRRQLRIRRRPVTPVLVNHDLDEVIGLADRVFSFSGSPARAVADVPIQNPRSARTADEVAMIRNELSRRAIATPV
jgi:ABC-type nitrate/sulfonate/bicarbonate transport system ATPase subunit